jgi:hypothetical protein
MRRDKNNGAVFMKLFFASALFLAGLFISINPFTPRQPGKTLLSILILIHSAIKLGKIVV